MGTYRLKIYILRKIDNAGLLVPYDTPAKGNIVELDNEYPVEIYDKLLYFLIARTDLDVNQQVLVNGEIIGYTTTYTPAGSPLVYAEYVPSDWRVLWSRAIELLSQQNYEEYVFQCINKRINGDRLLCYLPGSNKPVPIDVEKSRSIMGIDPYDAGLPRFIGNLTSTSTPIGLTGLGSYIPQVIPYLSYIYEMLNGDRL